MEMEMDLKRNFEQMMMKIEKEKKDMYVHEGLDFLQRD
jgi:hypothetical protein